MGRKIVDETLKFEILINGNQGKKEYNDLEKANRKLIEANADLEKQAKKLASAKQTESQAYKKIRSEIEKNTTTLNKNKERMSDLSKEIGINNLSMRQLAQEARKLNAILSNLDPETDEWKKYNEELQSVKGRMANLRKEMQPIQESMEDQLKAIGKLAVGFGQVFSGIKRGDFEMVSNGFNTIKNGIEGARKAALAFIATPIGIVLAVLAGIGAVAREWFKYNESIRESIFLTEEITRLQGKQADSARIQAQAITDTFGTDFKENLEIARNLVRQFSISYDEAFQIISNGLIKGGKNNQEYLDGLREYPTFFAQAGFSASEFSDIINAGYDLGIYSDKLPDAIKEFDISLREQTKATREALLNAFGKTFTDNLLRRIKTGEITTKEALSEISKEAQRLGLNIEQNQRLTADIFRGAGEDAGGAIKIFNAVNKAAMDATRELTPLEKATKELADANLDLAQAQDEALKSDNYVSFTRDLELFWKKIKTLFFQGVKFITDTFTKVQDFTVSFILSIIVTAQQLPDILKQGLKEYTESVVETIKTLGGLGDVIYNLSTFNFSKAKESAKEFSENFKRAFGDVKDSASETIKKIINTQQQAQILALQTINKRRKGSVQSSNESPSTEIPLNQDNGNDFERDQKAEQEAKKAAERELRKRQKVEEAIKKFEEEKAIREALKKIEKDKREEEEEILRIENKFAKLEEDAAGETELLKQLEELKLSEIQAVRDRYAEERIEKEKSERDKILQDVEKHNKNLAESEKELIEAKYNAAQQGISILRGFVGESKGIGKALFLLQQGLAVAQVIGSTSKAIAGAWANEALIPAFLPPGIPNPVKPLSLAATTKTVAIAKFAAATQIASILATTIQGFEDGLYPIKRNDGKTFKTKFGGSPNTQIVSSPTHFIAGEVKPEMIIDGDTFKKMDPAVTNYIMSLAGKQSSSNENQGTSQSNNNEMLTNAVMMLVDRLNTPIIAETYYGIDSERRRKEVEKKLNITRNNAKIRRDAI
ncbi:hypothetical protein [Abyssalbus ytuae]|uniref:Phage tail tape measure protein domain-containing protein n=1 Tax=Abyssalbus ytuae TaxID=2926907 RepID=A0A9E7CYE8_9FLAO|nr:hypothetical protein [Abyssalbus ytuae]UOB16570.1 hypothetical protein MQE35_12595 [Abyssalbus ytuae]